MYGEHLNFDDKTQLVREDHYGYLKHYTRRLNCVMNQHKCGCEKSN